MEENMHMPDEIWLKIFSFLDAISLGKCGRVSTMFNRLSHEDELWKELYNNSWFCGYLSSQLKFTEESSVDLWRHVYIDRVIHDDNINEYDILKIVGKGAGGKISAIKKRDIIMTPKENNLFSAVNRMSNYFSSTHLDDSRFDWLNSDTTTINAKDHQSKHETRLKSVLAMKVIPIASLSADIYNIREHGKQLKALEDNEEITNYVVPLTSYFFSEDHDHDQVNLHLLMDFQHGGDLMTILQKHRYLTEAQARFFAAELVLALETIHKHFGPIKYLKPSNILRDSNGHIKITLSDYGKLTGYSLIRDPCMNFPHFNRQQATNKIKELLETPYDRALDTYVTRTERAITWMRVRRKMNTDLYPLSYTAPEVIIHDVTSDSEESVIGTKCDAWTLGVLLFEMLIGYPAFCSDTADDIIHKVAHWKESLRFPKHEMSLEAEDLITKLLCHQSERLDVPDLKKHPFFKYISWENLKNCAVPLMPIVSGQTDFSNFEDFDHDEMYDQSNDPVLQNLRTTNRLFMSNFNY